MNIKAGTSYKILLVHLLVWVVYIFYELSILLYSDAKDIVWSEIILAFLLNAGVFYATSALILPWCSKHQRWWLLPAGIVVLIGIYLALSYAETTWLFPLVDAHAADALASLSLYNARHVYRATNFIALGTGYWFAREAITKERLLRQVEQDRFLHLLQEKELGRELAISELKYYRARLNPHFLFNTLNFFYANLRDVSHSLGQALLLFSQTMRYMILQDRADGMAALSDEIEQMKNYIELNQLRFRHSLEIQLTVNGSSDEKKIVPFVMMTLLENAFKYGDMTDSLQPTRIVLNITHQIELIIENKINSTVEKSAGDGIGLNGIRKLLELIYQEHYSLEITQTDERFRAYLKISVPHDQLYYYR